MRGRVGGWGVVAVGVVVVLSRVRRSDHLKKSGSLFSSRTSMAERRGKDNHPGAEKEDPWPAAEPVFDHPVPVPGVSNATRLFVVLSHQRGGSHFASSLMKVASGRRIACEGELARGPVSNWTEWTTMVEAALAQVASTKPVAAGFILHHNQLLGCDALSGEDEFARCVDIFAAWASSRGVAVVHLVRETALMIVASTYVQNLQPGHVSTTRNQSVADYESEFAAAHGVDLSDGTLAEIKRLEFEFDRADLSLASQSHHRLAYESLLASPYRELSLRAVLAFIGLDAPDPRNVVDAFATSTLRLHPPTCASRVANWNQTKYRLSSTTRAACNRLDTILAAAAASDDGGSSSSGGGGNHPDPSLLAHFSLLQPPPS